ncbi:MAG: hypothetical protein CMO44_15305 [Verrucomicrobiales bacterium]|nr:hypothetical protein [Verrucomicrobiales bacterium]
MYMTELDKENIISKLKDNIMNINFTKRDGSTRRMKATLREDLIPQATKADPLSQKKIRNISPEVQPVWDIDNAGWRSFRWDSLIGANNVTGS